MSLNPKLASTAFKLVDKYGKSMTLVRTASTHSTSTLIATNTTTSYTCKGVIAPPSTDRFNRGNLGRASERTVYIGSLNVDVAPIVGDVLTFDDVSWPVLDVEPFYVEDSPVLYALAVKS